MAFELFVHLIKNGMKETDLSLREVARLVEVDPSFLSKILAGKRSPPGDENILKKLADVLNIDPLRLIVSTGTIPSAWQSFFDDEEFLRDLIPYLKTGAPWPQRKIAVPIYKTKELSEDLL